MAPRDRDMPTKRLRHLEQGTVLMRKSERATSVYMIKTGLLSVYDVFNDGSKTEIARLGPGQLVGELAMLENREHSLYVEAVLPSDVYAFSKEEFNAIVNEAHPLMQSLVKILAKRLHDTDEDLLIAKGQDLLLTHEIDLS